MVKLISRLGKCVISKSAALFGNQINKSDSPVLTGFMAEINKVPGMISITQALVYYWINFTQGQEGDVLEIGCWQGRSTIALAQACKDSGNGIVHAVDHFKGNPGKKIHYVIEKEDLSDLQQNFQRNISNAGLSEFVSLYAENVDQVAISGKIRLLVIDGEHSYNAVLSDFLRFRKMLTAGAIAIFDDYSEDFPEVIQAVEKIHKEESGSKISRWGQMAVLTFPG
jgi:predicted O-methyltransferase YrrM